MAKKRNNIVNVLSIISLVFLLSAFAFLLFDSSKLTITGFATAQCQDSDNGKAYNVKGTVTYTRSNGSDGTKTDRCLDTSNLREFFCSNTEWAYKDYSCSCSDGRCTAQSTCKPSGQSCSATSDCCSGLTCTGGTCQTTTTACSKKDESCVSNACCNGLYCKNNVCKDPGSLACWETDNGKDYDVKGTVTYTKSDGTQDTKTDRCDDYSLLKEFFCKSDGDWNSELYTCPYSCDDGKCIAQSAASCTSNEQCSSTQFCKLQTSSCSGTGTCTTKPAASSCSGAFTPICGCNGITYNNEACANAYSVSKKSDNYCSSSVSSCTSNEQCSSTQFCKFPTSSCSGTGTCTTKPAASSCSGAFTPICGCNGITYNNEACANAYSVSKKNDGTCSSSSGCMSEGEIIKYQQDSCCLGFTKIVPKSPNDDSLGICTAKCGNGICDEESETGYNCIDDCFGMQYKAGIYRPGTSSFFLKMSNHPQAPYASFAFGNQNDIPVYGDWDGNNKFEVGVKRGNSWYLDYNSNDKFDNCQIDKCYTFGIATDIPITGDWNGDGKWEIGVKKSGSNNFVLDYNGNGISESADKSYYFGLATDIPITGDWNGDNKTKIGVKRSYQWIIDYNGDGIFSTSYDKSYNLDISSGTPVPADWNGDNKFEIGIKDGSDWYIDYDADGSFEDNSLESFSFGKPTDIPLSAPWAISRSMCSTSNQMCSSAVGISCCSNYICIYSSDESGTGTCRPNLKKTDKIGVYRPSSSTFFLRNSNSGDAAYTSFTFGRANDTALFGDWDGDGIDDVGIYRNYTATPSFYLRPSSNGKIMIITFSGSQKSDVPITGDWNGDGKDTIGIYTDYEDDNEENLFQLRDSNTNGSADVTINFGSNGDIPVAGDWNNDGKDEIGIYRPSEDTFYLRQSNGTILYATFDNIAIDVPITGDWNGDGKDTIGSYNSATSRFYLMNSNAAGTPSIMLTFGRSGDIPISGSWNITTTCSNECSTNGLKQCSGNAYQVCGNYDSDACLEWGSSTDCPSSLVCSGEGICQTPDTDCVRKNQRCDTSDECCFDLVCSTNGRCVENTTSSCIDKCSLQGSKQCSGNDAYQVCDDYDYDTCLEWGSSISCQLSEACESDGFCKAKTTAKCGDDYCDKTTETSINCPEDCKLAKICNNDGYCDSSDGENSRNCPEDCPLIKDTECNNNGDCELNEDETNCPNDCKKSSATWYILIGLLILLVVLVLTYFLYIKKKKPKLPGTNANVGTFRQQKNQPYFYKTR